MKSYNKPTSEQIEATLPMLSSPQHEAYFFGKLNNPHWIEPLRARQVFDHPPTPEPVEGGGVRFPTWPASRYLARMASNSPSEVAAIFAAIETDNVSVIGDLLRAALEMPANIAATLVSRISQAAQRGHLWDVDFTKATDLCIQLANGDEVNPAMTLAEALFNPKVDKGKDRPHRRDDFWYKEELTKLVPILTTKRPREFLRNLCNWLNYNLSSWQGVDPQTGSDNSHSWRPAIEEHAQNLDYELSSVMVGFIRKGFELAIRDGMISLDDVFEILDEFGYLIFKRIRLYLINEYGERIPELVQRAIMDRDLFDNYEYKHEYAMLVGRRLNLLSPEDRETWFEWIDAGPDKSTHEDLSDEQKRDHVRYWRFEKLHCVREHLHGERKKFYDEMFATCGVPELADLNVRFEVGSGFISPMTVDELSKLNFSDAVERVCSWRPTQSGFRAPEIEGLASTFEHFVATNPELFSTQSKLLIDRPAIYVRTFINQMANAIKNGREIDITTVLDLCDWVLTRPISELTMTREPRDALLDKDWQWSRNEIADFVRGLCDAKTEERPKFSMKCFRVRFWSLVGPLCCEPTKSYVVRDISEDDPRVWDYLDLRINSPRGKAMEAALAYARWIANHLKKTSGGNEIVPGGFNAMTEVREMLEWQIEPDNRSIEAFAVIGSHINLIYWIDKDWLAANAARLFHLEGDEQSSSARSGWAAWNAFVFWVRPHFEYYKLFKKQYAHAVARCALVELPKESREQPMFHLGEHLMVLYGRGQLGLDEHQELLRRFLNDSNPDIRRHAIGFVGDSLKGEEKVPDAVVSRFIVLWEVYWRGAGKKDAEERPDSWLFGSWFSSGKFPRLWALKQLEDFVKVVPTPQPEHGIAEQLAKTCVADIVTAVRILDRMVRGDREGWRIFGWREQATVILKKALIGGADARAQAEQIINYLGRRGFTEFGGLLGARPYQPVE